MNDAENVSIQNQGILAKYNGILHSSTFIDALISNRQMNFDLIQNKQLQGACRPVMLKIGA